MPYHRQRHIQLYEHDRIRVGEVRNGHTFTEADWNQLLQLNEQQYPPYLQPIHRGIRTLNYVGLIQLPGLCLEILPKTDLNDANQNRYLLLQLLDRCKKIPAISQMNRLAKHQDSISDYFLIQFLEETEKLLRKGLIKKYRRESANFSRFRGKMLVREHIRHNHVHKERIYAEYQAYDTQHHLHGLLKKALNEIPKLSGSSEILHRSKQLFAEFPEGEVPKMIGNGRKEVRLTQQDQHYATAISWAHLILDKLSPRLQKGNLSCRAFLFDMQQLFEEVVTRELAAAATKMGHQLQIQPSRNFWRQRKIRPDMVLKTGDGENIILDTKWKILKNQQPDEADLKQMYIYNRFFRAKRGLIIYPRQPGEDSQGDHYCEREHNALRCDLLFIDLMGQSSGKFNEQLGSDILKQILSADQGVV